MIEVKNADAPKAPKNWIKVSGTKAVSRFHSPQIVKFIQEREQQKESLGIECDRAYSEFLRYTCFVELDLMWVGRFRKSMNFSGMWFRILGCWIVCFRWRRWLRCRDIRNLSLWILGELKLLVRDILWWNRSSSTHLC